LPVFNPWPVRVPCDNCLKTGDSGVEIKVVDVVQDIEGNATGFDYFRLRELTRPGSLIVVAPNGDEGCDLAQALEDCRSADIPCMENDVTTAKSIKHLVTEESVCIRDKTY